LGHLPGDKAALQHAACQLLKSVLTLLCGGLCVLALQGEGDSALDLLWKKKQAEA
jgi:hypothetical protein